MELQFPCFSLVSAFIIFLSIRIWKKSKTSNSCSNLPPGPWKLPLLGNIHHLLGSLPHRRLRGLANIYGPVMRLQLGEVISSPEMATKVFKTHEINFVDRPRPQVASILFYDRQDIAFAPYGYYWRQMRKICMSEYFSSRRVQSFKSIREEEVSKFITSISAKARFPINLSKMIISLTNAIIARTTIGIKYENRRELFNPIVEAWTEAVGGFGVVDVFPSFKLLHMISGTSSRLKRAQQEADKMLENIINEGKCRREAGDKGEIGTLLDVLLDLQDLGNLNFPLTNENIKAIILDMITAGSDTSSAIVEWAMSEMLKNPRIMKKAQEEVRRVFSQNGSVDETCFQELKFLKSIIKETLRIHPPTPLIPRECRERCEINGYDIHAKTEILINIWAIGRDPNY